MFVLVHDCSFRAHNFLSSALIPNDRKISVPCNVLDTVKTYLHQTSCGIFPKNPKIHVKPMKENTLKYKMKSFVPFEEYCTHHGMCMTHVPWCMPGSLISGFLWRGNRPGIPGACATHIFTYLVRDPSCGAIIVHAYLPQEKSQI